MSTDEKKFTLRLPHELDRILEELAEKDLRSKHAEIITLLKEAVQARLTSQTASQNGNGQKRY